MDLKNWFSEFYIHEKSWDTPTATRARKFISTPAIKVNQRPYPASTGLMDGEEFDKSKKRLYLSPHQGHFFRKCPGTSGAACCNYYVFNLGAQCTMNCSYCYLQSYINTPLTQIFTNIEDGLMELEKIVKDHPGVPFRIGTGEVIDSLILDDISGHSEILVDWFAKHPHLTCEFKTKSDKIENFVYKNHAGNVVVSFSVNPSSIVLSEEHRTASLEKRLSAARKAKDNGFPVAFHIDPMIYVENWAEIYSELAHEITSLFKSSEVKWISVGALRYPPEMKNILRERFAGNSQSVTAELFLSRDGKLRYDLNLRNKMFKHLMNAFKKVDKSYPLFLCMETPEAWLGTLETTPLKTPGLGELFRPFPAI